jgi:hypothetical protein
MTPLLILGNMLVPGLLDRYLADSAWEGQETARQVRPDRRDNLFNPVSGLHRTVLPYCSITYKAWNSYGSREASTPPTVMHRDAWRT